MILFLAFAYSMCYSTCYVLVMLGMQHKLKRSLPLRIPEIALGKS